MSFYVTDDTLAHKTTEWLTKIAPYNTHAMELHLEKAALMIIDMQVFFLDPISPSFTCGGRAIISNVKSLLDTFRHHHRPVIFTRHMHHPQLLDAGIMEKWWRAMCVEGTPESEIHPDLAPLPTEKQVLKHRYSAFYNTDLETILRCAKIEDLVITGLMTNMCCESTARDAYYRDYRVFFVADGTGSINEEMHLASLLNLSFGFAYVTTTTNIERNIEGKK